MTTAVDKWPAYARLSAVAQAGHLPTAPTPPPGTRPTMAVIVDFQQVTTLLGGEWCDAPVIEDRHLVAGPAR